MAFCSTLPDKAPATIQHAWQQQQPALKHLASRNATKSDMATPPNFHPQTTTLLAPNIPQQHENHMLFRSF
jgi:hypothetical protein